MLPDHPEVLILILAFQVKHFLGDFAFQTGPMVMGKGAPGWQFAKPLSIHCLIHSVLTTIVLAAFSILSFWPLIVIDFVIHFIIDRLKSGPRYAGRVKMNESPQLFWFFFGLDQLLHQMTYLFFVYLLVA